MEMNPANDDKPATQDMVRATQGMVLATRDMLRATERSLRAEMKQLAIKVLQVDAKVDRLDEKMESRFREMMQMINARFDAFLGKLEGYSRETVMLPKTLDHHGKILSDHEKRIRALEP